jgi:hypothetical protein
LFSVLGFLALNGVAWILLQLRIKPVLVGREVWLAMDHARDATSATTLILGDSVARQLYDRRNESSTGFLHVTSNQAISMAGQELLLRFALQSNPQLKRVVLLSHPSGFFNDLDQPFTYNYFAKPFCNLATWPQLSSLVKERMARKVELWAAFLPLVKASQLLSNVNYTPSGGSLNATGALAPITTEALQSMQNLCAARGIAFELRSPPVSSEQNYERLRADVREHGMEGLFAGYFATMPFLPARIFVDEIHIVGTELPRFRGNWLRL